MVALEEQHARQMLSAQLGVDVRFHDDGSESSMPDLLSVDARHVAEVVTTVLPSVREAERGLDPIIDANLPHCVWVAIPYARLGGVTRGARQKIKVDVLRWVTKSDCRYHWSSRNERQLLPRVDPDPILRLGAYTDSVEVLCVQRCEHSNVEPHRIVWSVVHEPPSDDPWSLLRRSLRVIDAKQRGGVQALAAKLSGHPNKHLVLYPFGPPGNLTAALSRYVLPPSPRDLLPPHLLPPLNDVHLWLFYRYGDRGVTEGLHVCNEYWAKFGTGLPMLGLSTPYGHSHYGGA